MPHLRNLVLVVSVLLGLATDEGFVRVGGDVPMPSRVHFVEPEYPPIAGQVVPQVVGIVILEVGLNEEGRPIDIKVLYGVPLLDAAAIDAVKQWRFQPTLISGKPTRVAFREVVDVFPDAGSRSRYFARMVQDRKEQKALRLIAADRLRTGGWRQKHVLDGLRKATIDADSDISAAAGRALQALGGR